MLDYVNVTPLLEPIVNWAEYASYESSATGHDMSSKQTSPVEAKSDLFELFVSKAGVNAPTAIQDTKLNRFFTPASSSRGSVVKQRYLVQDSYSNAEVDRIAKQRIRLMAVKYASNSTSAEIVARLEILNQRLLNRSPRVSQTQVDLLEIASDKLARISMAREERSRRLGIPT